MVKIESLKKTLRSYLPSEIDLNDFIKTEMTLAVLEHLAPNEDAGQAYLLLHNYSLIGNITEKDETHFLQNAHICLRYCSSKQRWEQLLEMYREDVPEQLCFYKLSDELYDGKNILKLRRNEKATIASDRIDIYLEHIKRFSENHNTNYAKACKYQYWIGNEDKPWAEVNIPEHKTKLPVIPDAKSEIPAIKITLSELLKSAKEMQEIYPDDYCYDALQSNTIRTVNNGHVVKAEELSINEVVNMVGMVGAGKSTLMKVLAYHLSKQNKKIVIVLDTVADTFHMYSYFRRLNMNVTPLIGRNEREKYIYQVAEQGEKFIKSEYSEYLTAPCIVGGMAQSDNKTVRYGKEPCKKLIKDGKQYTCPLIDICPAVKMYRDIITSNVIVTTIQGLAAIRILGDNRLFLEYVLEQADLVMFDECDKVQKTLDEFFTPSTEFAEFMKTSANDCANDMRLETAAIDGMGANAKHYSELRFKSFAMSERVRETINATTGSWKNLLKETFSSMTLYRQLCKDSEKEKHPLTPHVIEALEKAMDAPEDEELEMILEYVKERENERKFSDRLKKWLERNNCKYDAELIQHIKLYLIVIQFDKYVHSLDEQYSFLSEEQKSEMELFNFLQARFTAQQKLLPSAVMGNLFGMRNDNKKGLQLYRQYAFGRAMMTRMPWLRLTENGKPAGPHVLLLSGSSWAEGCLEYHVNTPVQYLLEAEEWKRNKLSETEIVDLNTCIRVSGGGQDERSAHLKQVIKSCEYSIEAELKSDSKILMIVNSYSEAKIAVKYLNSLWSEKPAACMIRITDEVDLKNESKVLRGEVGSFDKHVAKILVAPAQAIERGYNIVDENGHSTFGSVFFLVRPMAVPDEISSKCAKLNGIIEKRFCSEKDTDAFKKAYELRQYAAKQWKVMEEQSKKSLTFLNDTMKKDVTASLFILILQIFGRLARITDKNKPAPKVFFADGAFRTAPDHPDGYDCLNELRDYLEQMMSDETSGEIAKTLYEPFYEAFKKGVNNNVYTDIPYGDDPEDEYIF